MNMIPNIHRVQQCRLSTIQTIRCNISSDSNSFLFDSKRHVTCLTLSRGHLCSIVDHARHNRRDERISTYQPKSDEIVYVSGFV